jgi:hypothetical protein
VAGASGTYLVVVAAMHRVLAWSAVFAGSFALACANGGHKALPGDGDQEGPGATPSSGLATAFPPGKPVGTQLISNTALCSGAATAVGPSPLRRISRVEYDNMVRDLLGDATQPANGFVSESPLANGVNFDTNTYTLVTSTLIPQQYLQAAETLAEAAVTKNLSTVVSCSSQANDACATQFIGDFANRAFRGQLDATESSSLFQLYSDVKAQFDFATGIQAVITAVLTSPRFLFVLEFGDGSASGGVVPLSPSETATRLALYLWRSIPDDVLLKAAAAGQLATPDDLEAQVVRMLKDDRARDALNDFATQWLELENADAVTKDTQYGDWSPALAHDLRMETLDTYGSLVLSENGGLTDLLTSPSSYINEDVGTFYGVSVSGTADALGFTKTNVNPDPAHPVRAGILTDGSVLATQAHTLLPSPVLRGKLVREQVLCDPIPPPPAGLNIPPPPLTVAAGTTTRDEFEAHADNPLCTGCHKYMDPIGLGFGHFDASGKYQATDANGDTDGAAKFAPIDATGAVNPIFTGDLSATFDGALDLAKQLAASDRVQECFALEQIRYALGRLESTADACSAQKVFQAFSPSLNIQALMTAVVRSDAFRYRTVVTPGSACQ